MDIIHRLVEWVGMSQCKSAIWAVAANAATGSDPNPPAATERASATGRKGITAAVSPPLPQLTATAHAPRRTASSRSTNAGSRRQHMVYTSDAAERVSIFP